MLGIICEYQRLHSKTLLKQWNRMWNCFIFMCFKFTVLLHNSIGFNVCSLDCITPNEFQVSRQRPTDSASIWYDLKSLWRKTNNSESLHSVVWKCEKFPSCCIKSIWRLESSVFSIFGLSSAVLMQSSLIEQQSIVHASLLFFFSPILGWWNQMYLTRWKLQMPRTTSIIPWPTPKGRNHAKFSVVLR